MKISKPVLQGRGVVLRPLTVEDAEAMHASLDAPTSRRLTGTHARYGLDEVRAHLARVADAEDRLDYGILVDGRLIGEAVLNHVDWPNRSASFRIAIWMPEDRGKGYGSEATALLVRHGFAAIGLNRIELTVYAFNPAARRVYEKVGFKLEGTRREALLWDGEFVDAHVMSILRREQSAGDPS